MTMMERLIGDNSRPVPPQLPDSHAMHTAYTHQWTVSRAIRGAKCAHTQSVHSQFNDGGDTHYMWQSIQAITNEKRRLHLSVTVTTSLLDALKDFYAQFEEQSNKEARKIIPPPNNQHLNEKLSLMALNTSLCNWILDWETSDNVTIVSTSQWGWNVHCPLLHADHSVSQLTMERGLSSLWAAVPSMANDTVSKPYSMAGLTTVLYTFPLILADIF
ncbi:hypothetical protein QTP70_010442 [Hemibagrus guttatus]|uniref:Uncharacterized protein n=1 Tax=Hemibagrus guttatus TaxID=175788 RepID=A0AAE0QKI6_9TELE|nr:hypothetical protein QTP70_010442 [Hemibagrus guttatus]